MARPKTKMVDPKVAVGYVRVSTGRQAAEGISLEHQQDAIRAYCTMNGLSLTEIVVDAGHSAYKQPLRRRADGKRVTALVSKRRVGAVVTLRLDRLFRSIQDCINTTMSWDQTGVALHLISLGGASVDTSTAMGRIMIALLSGFGELESEAKAERARDAWDYKRARGERLGSKPPFGYKMDAAGHQVPHPDEQRAIRLIQQMRSEGVTVDKIRTALEAEGLPPRGKCWHATTINRILEKCAA